MGCPKRHNTNLKRTRRRKMPKMKTKSGAKKRF